MEAAQLILVRGTKHRGEPREHDTRRLGCGRHDFRKMDKTVRKIAEFNELGGPAGVAQSIGVSDGLVTQRVDRKNDD